MIRDDEKRLLVNIYLQLSVPEDERLCARDIASDLGMCYQRAYFLFNKWERKRLYESGVNAGLGWLTPEGEVIAGTWLLEGS